MRVAPPRTYCRNKGRLCDEPGCNQPAYSRHFCRKHYNSRYWRGLEHVREERRRYRASAEGRAANKRYRATHKEYLKNYHRVYGLKKYGMTLEDYQALSRKQGGVCAICRKPPRRGRLLCVDHNHVTNLVRGLVCSGCNVTVGFLEKDPVRLAQAQEYLLRYQSA